MLDDEGYIIKPFTIFKSIKIPEGFKKCSSCHGMGEVVKIFKDPGPNEYMTCPVCDGVGYVRALSSSGKQKTENK